MRKLLLPIALFYALICFGQLKTTTSVDEMEGTKRVETEYLPFKTEITGVRLAVGLSEDIYTIQMEFTEGSFANGCFSDYDGLMKIKLTDGTVIDCKQFSDTECGSYGLVVYAPISGEAANMPDWKDTLMDNVKSLASNPWELIRIYKTEYYIELKPESTRRNKEPEKFFQQAISAVNNAYYIN